MIYQCLLDALDSQQKRVFDRIKERFASGDKMAALELNAEKKFLQSTKDWMTERREAALVAPQHKIVKRKVVLPDIDSAIPDGKLLVRCICVCVCHVYSAIPDGKLLVRCICVCVCVTCVIAVCVCVLWSIFSAGNQGCV
jgi:hypothetical protein